MQSPEMSLTPFYQILIFAVAGVVFISVTLIASQLLRPNRPSDQKLMTYESGEAPQGLAWVQFNMRFYVLALIFLLFEVEIVFLFPWSTVFANTDLNSQTGGSWSWFAFSEMLIFVLILAAGLVYVWKMGFLDWVKSNPEQTNFRSPVPKDFYNKINEKYKRATHPNQEIS
jgi:NADH-quinone oxidoreductase subunit A